MNAGFKILFGLQMHLCAHFSNIKLRFLKKSLMHITFKYYNIWVIRFLVFLAVMLLQIHAIDETLDLIQH